MALAASDAVSSYEFGVVPLFVLMGLLVSVAGIGRDTFGDEALALFQDEHVGTTHLVRSDRNTGVGFIILDAEN